MKKIILGLVLFVFIQLVFIKSVYSSEIEKFCSYYSGAYTTEEKNNSIDYIKCLKDEKTKLYAEKKDTKYKEGTYYCWDPERKYTFTRDIKEHANLLNRCEKELQPIAIEITKYTYDKAQKIINDPSYQLWNPQHQQKLVDLISNSKEVIAHSPNRQQITKIETSKTSEMLTHDSRIKFVNECEKRYLRFSSEFNKCFQDFIVLENLTEEKGDKKNNQITLSKKSEINLNDPKFSKKCEGGIFTNGFKKGTSEFNDCIKREQKLATLEEQKKQIMNENKNRKVQEKQELDQAKNKEEQIKVSKMKPEDRHAYTCSEKFGFKRSTDKFKDCIFEMYKAETELEKLELQKQVAKANAEAARAGAEAARAGAERQERLSLAQTEAAKMQAYALEQQAIASKTANNLILLETGLRMLSPAPAPPRTTTTCSFNGRFMNCF